MRFSTLSVSQFSYCCSGLRRLKLAGKWERVAAGGGGGGKVDDDDGGGGAALALIFIVSPLCHRSRHFCAVRFSRGYIYHHPLFGLRPFGVPAFPAFFVGVPKLIFISFNAAHYVSGSVGLTVCVWNLCLSVFPHACGAKTRITGDTVHADCCQ